MSCLPSPTPFRVYPTCRVSVSPNLRSRRTQHKIEGLCTNCILNKIFHFCIVSSVYEPFFPAPCPWQYRKWANRIRVTSVSEKIGMKCAVDGERWLVFSSCVARLLLDQIRNQGIHGHAIDRIVKSWAVKIKFINGWSRRKHLATFFSGESRCWDLRVESIISRCGWCGLDSLGLNLNWFKAEPEPLGLPGKAWCVLWKK